MKSESNHFIITAFDLLRDGHGNGVGIDSGNRITLASSSTVTDSGPLASPAGIAVDRSKILFIIDKSSGFIYYNCPGTSVPVRVPCIGGLGQETTRFRFNSCSDPQYRRLWQSEEGNDESAGAGQSSNRKNVNEDGTPFFGGIAASKQFIAVSDTGNYRVQCFFRRSLQISYIIDNITLKNMHDHGNWQNFAPEDLVWENFVPWDCVIDSFGDLYVIDSGSKILLRISRRGNLAVCMGREELKDPVSLFLDESDTLYVLDRGRSAILKKTAGPEGAWSIAATLDSVEKSNRVLGLAVDKNNTIYAGEGGNGDDLLFHFWNSDGEYAGKFLNAFGGCKRMAAGEDGIIYAECANSGVVRLNDQKAYVTEGYFFSRVLDGGERMAHSRWHRIVADADLSPGTSLGIDYVAEDEIIKVSAPCKIEPSRWRRLFDVYGEDSISPDVLMTDAKGRYLVLRIRLGGNSECTPKIRRIRITCPHDSYLRYLPAAYQDDPIGSDLTDRFMSLFESLNMDIEEQITSVTRLFDPAATRVDFLPWLASWLGIVQDHNWPEEKFRELLSCSYSLFKKRGTIDGLIEMLELYTGSKPKIIEHFRYLRPMVLGADLLVGMSTIVGRKFTEPLVIEESSTIGAFTLIEEEEPPEATFNADAYDFTVIVGAPDLTKEQQACLVRIIEHEKPAHTRYCLRISGDGLPRIGTALLGIDTRLTHAYRPMETGATTILGTAAITGTRYPGYGIYGACSQIGISSLLQ